MCVSIIATCLCQNIAIYVYLDTVYFVHGDHCHVNWTWILLLRIQVFFYPSLYSKNFIDTVCRDHFFCFRYKLGLKNKWAQKYLATVKDNAFDYSHLID